jgi:hypothetical protein
MIHKILEKTLFTLKGTCENIKQNKRDYSGMVSIF